MQERSGGRHVPRRTILGTIPKTIAAAAMLPMMSDSQETGMNPFVELFQISQAEKKGLTFYIGGQTLPGIVTKVGGDTVEVRSQSQTRIVIRLDRVDAVALA